MRAAPSLRDIFPCPRDAPRARRRRRDVETTTDDRRVATRRAHQSMESKSRYIDSETSPEGVYSPRIASLIRSSTRRSGPTPTRASCSTRLAGLPVTPRAIDAVTNGKDAARRNASAVRPIVSSPTSSVDVSAAPASSGYVKNRGARAVNPIRSISRIFFTAPGAVRSSTESPRSITAYARASRASTRSTASRASAARWVSTLYP